VDAKYWYQYKFRGLSIGCQPDDFVDHDGSIGKFGAISYARPLTEKEVKEFELEPASGD
jgi:hypothetical protein